jgi:hypothetical protein
MDLHSPRSSLSSEGSELDLSKTELLGEESKPRAWDPDFFRLKQRPSGWKRALLAPTLTLFLILIGVVIYITLPILVHRAPTGREFGDCGTNSVEARANGCVFDHLSYVWLQPQCYHPELLAGYNNRTGVTYYSEKSMEDGQLIPMPEIERGDHDRAWAPRKFHSMHCAFTVSKMHYALVHHLPIDSAAVSFKHTEHCQMVLLDEVPECLDGKCSKSRLTARYTSCGYV